MFPHDEDHGADHSSGGDPRGRAGQVRQRSTQRRGAVGLAWAGGAKVAEEAVTKAAEGEGGQLAAGAYYHVTDARFTAWGKYSEVLVPNAAANIAKVAKGISILGWLVTDIELAHAIDTCSGKL